MSGRVGHFLDWYQGRKVLVTGGASFIGSHLTELLVTHGATVRVADDLSSGLLSNLADVSDDVDVVIGDLRDHDVAERACRDQEVVFHLAAAHGGRGYIDTHPVECCSNMSLDHTLFATAVAAGADRIVYASSACAYPVELQDDPTGRGLLREDMCGFDRPGGTNADGEYGWAKLMGELQLRAFHRQHGIDGVACRIFTAYGERENESHAVIALIAKAVGRLDPYPIWGDGTQTRNFTYVGDTVRGIALGGAWLKGFEVLNVGSPVHTSVLELIEQIFSAGAWRPSSIDAQLGMPIGVKSRAADCTKISTLFGWYPDTTVEEGIARTMKWYQDTVTVDRLARLESLLMVRG
jgi:UDP-glucose 4-epimerase